MRKQVKNPCEARKIKASQILHKKISTHHLTVLIIGAIVQIEQRKRDKEIRRLKENLLDVLHTNRVQNLKLISR